MDQWIIGRMSGTEREAPAKLVSGETPQHLGRDAGMIVEAADLPSVTVSFDDGSFRVTAPHSHTGDDCTEEAQESVVPGTGPAPQNAYRRKWTAGGAGWVTF